MKRGNMNHKIVWALCCLTSALFAEEEVAANQPQKLPKSTPEHPIPEKVVTCSYDCDLFSKDVKVFFTNIEVLYWTVNEGALDYAVKMKNPAWGDPTDAVGHYQRGEFGWSPGVRINFGYFNAPHYWDAQVQYTYYYASGHEGVNAPKASALFLNGTWPQPDPSGLVPLAHAHSEITFWTHLVDLLATRRFHPNPHLRIRVNGGVKIGWLRQNWEIDYRDTAGNKSHLHNLWHFMGAGVQFGGIVDWFMGKGGYYITGGATMSFMAGDYHNSSKQKSNFSGAGFNPALPLRNVHYQDTRLIPHFQVFVGPSWQQSYKKIRTEVYIGYELNLWANLHEVIRTTSGAATAPKLTTLDSGWLGIQGVTVRWNLDF
jgi:hypothetical protein